MASRFPRVTNGDRSYTQTLQPKPINKQRTDTMPDNTPTGAAATLRRLHDTRPACTCGFHWVRSPGASGGYRKHADDCPRRRSAPRNPCQECGRALPLDAPPICLGCWEGFYPDDE